jgi:PleD family two-component response regulator
VKRLQNPLSRPIAEFSLNQKPSERAIGLKAIVLKDMMWCDQRGYFAARHAWLARRVARAAHSHAQDRVLTLIEERLLPGNVHVVDDDASFRTAIERRLKKAGYEVAT